MVYAVAVLLLLAVMLGPKSAIGSSARSKAARPRDAACMAPPLLGKSAAAAHPRAPEAPSGPPAGR